MRLTCTAHSIYITISFLFWTAVPSWSCSKAVHKPAWHIPLLSVQWINSWWWTEELSETCRVLCRNKFVKLVHLVGLITKKFVTMHGHMNVKNGTKLSLVCSVPCFIDIPGSLIIGDRQCTPIRLRVFGQGIPLHNHSDGSQSLAGQCWLHLFAVLRTWVIQISEFILALWGTIALERYSRWYLWLLLSCVKIFWSSARIPLCVYGVLFKSRVTLNCIS